MSIDVFVQQLGAWSVGEGTLHRRLAAAIEKAIRQGIVLPGTQLPPERKLAEALAVSRTTVVAAYNGLRTDGWLESRLGSGTWVAAGRAGAARQHAHAVVVESSPLMNVLQAAGADATDFATACSQALTELPEHLFRIAPDVQRAVLAERNYVPFGFPVLRDAIARQYRQAGVPTQPEQVLVTAGAQQAISLLTSLYVQHGDTVLVENPTYFGALQAFRLAGARLAGVAAGPKHVDAAQLRDRILATRPRLVHLTPTHHNPTGATMPETARRDVARLSQEFGTPIVEDCALADLAIEGLPPKPIAAFAGEGTVLTIGSMSKLYWAGLRIGWIRGPAGVIAQAARLKTAADLGCPLLTQVIGSQLLGALEQAKALRGAQLRTRRDLLVELLGEHLPEWRFTTPKGGLCLWVRLPGHDAARFTQYASRFGVSLAAGAIFAADDSCQEFLRIPFLLEEAAITEGVLRLKAAWQEFRSTASAGMTPAAPIV
jgi:DNA-binding transcriptional MocR family regulator